jgi:hypothetical protein
MIFIIHENKEWLSPFKEALEEVGAAYTFWYVPDMNFNLMDIPPEGVFYNRMSASSHDIPTLTVHDELIAEKKHIPMIREFMYSSGYSEVCSKYSLMNRIKGIRASYKPRSEELIIGLEYFNIAGR